MDRLETDVRKPHGR